MMRLRGVKKGTTAVTVFLLTGLLTAGLAFMAQVGRAEAPKIVVPADMHRGTVVTNKLPIMKINKDQFLVSQQVIVTDRQGRRLHIRDVMPGKQIKFHMTKGQIDRIECECQPRPPTVGLR